MAAPQPACLLDYLGDVPGPRSAHGRRHPLPAMLAATCRAILRGARGFTPIAQWVHDQELGLIHALGFTRRPPVGGLPQIPPGPRSDRLRGRADPLGRGLHRGPARRTRGGRRTGALALDGKTARGGAGPHREAIPLLSAMAQRSGLTLNQAEVGARTDQHKAALALLRGRVLRGRVVTAETISCRRDLRQAVITAGGHDFIAVKEDRPGPLAGHSGTPPTRRPTRPFPPGPRARTAGKFAEHPTKGKRRGRVEIRSLRTTALLNGYRDRPGVAQVCRVEREVKKPGAEASREVADAIAGAAPAAAGPATSPGRWRGHRGIEERSHLRPRREDGGDASRISPGAAPRIPAAVRNAAIGSLRCRGALNVAEALHRNAAQVRALLLSLGIVRQ